MVRFQLKTRMTPVGFLSFSLLAAGMLSGCAAPLARVEYAPVKSDIRTTLHETLAKGGTSASYAVLQNGAVVLADAVGNLDGTSKNPATVDTLYNIGSVSKIYTAAAVMKLVEEGKVSLDEPVVTYLPEFRMKDSRYREITVRMLLNHSSGIPGTDYIIGIVYGGYDHRFYDQVTADMARSVLKADPGKFSVYCNDGFEIAEMLVAKISGMPFDRYMQTRFFGPMGLPSPGYATRTFVPGSYTVMGSLPQEFPNVMGSGGVSTTATDLARFGALFLGNGAPVLSAAGIREINRPQGKTFIAEDTCSPLYGLGWDNVAARFGEADFGRGVLDKSGGTSQFTAQLYVMPEHNLTAAMAVTQDFKGDAPAILRRIVGRVLRAQGIETARPAPAAPALTPQPLPSGFEQEFAGYYGFSVGMFKVTVNGDQTITLMQHNGDAFVPMGQSLRYDGTAFVRSSGERLFRFVEADGRRYLMTVDERRGITMPLAQKLAPGSVPLGAWAHRMDRLFLPAEVDYRAVYVRDGMRLVRQEGLDGMVFMQEGKALSPLTILDDRNTGLVLQIPGSSGRDLEFLTVTTVNDEEWLAKATYPLRPAASLAEAASGTVTIPESGANGLFKIPPGKLTFTVPEKGRVFAYDETGVKVYDSMVQGATVSQVPKTGYIRFTGPPGVQFTVSVSPPPA